METTSNSFAHRARWLAVALAALVGTASLALFDAPAADAQRAGVSAEAGELPRFSVPGAGLRSFADVIDDVSPAVVNITVSKVLRPTPTGNSQQRSVTPLDEFYGRFFGAPGLPRGAEPAPRRSEGQGSGFIIDADGYVATNHHVVEGADEITVTLPSGVELEARVVGLDPQTDLALLKIDPSAADHELMLAAVEFGDSDRMRVGDWVLAIGNPFGLGGSATAGIVSARGRDIAAGPYDDYLQIDAPINSGNSGGPVFNAAGQVIGINTAIFSPNGGNIGIGFAIPANQARHVLDDLRTEGSVTRAWLGVQIQPLDSSLAAALGASDSGGALVSDVVTASPAERAGLQAGDVLTSIDGRAIDSPRTLARAVGSLDTGRSVELEYLRDGQVRSMTVELGELEAAAEMAGNVAPQVRGDRRQAAEDFGLQLDDLNERARSQLGLSGDARGAVVAGVSPQSPAAAQGIRPGDVIVSVNRSSVASAAEVADALAAARSAGSQALVLIRRGNSQRFVALAAS
jgi:serine protease Do